VHDARLRDRARRRGRARDGGRGRRIGRDDVDGDGPVEECAAGTEISMFYTLGPCVTGGAPEQTLEVTLRDEHDALDAGQVRRARKLHGRVQPSARAARERNARMTHANVGDGRVERVDGGGRHCQRNG
jgi:hypothetical protein